LGSIRRKTKAPENGGKREVDFLQRHAMHEQILDWSRRPAHTRSPIRIQVKAPDRPARGGIRIRERRRGRC
jgi:hypothetical protein